MGTSASKRVSRSFTDSNDFNSACDSVFEECLNLTQHAFPGVRPYQLSSAADRVHHSLSTTHPLIKKWVPTPPTRSQVDTAYRVVLTRRSGHEPDGEEEPCLGKGEFRAFGVEVFAGAVVANAGAAVIRRIPIGVAGIAGVGAVTRAGKDLVGTAIGLYALGIATSIYLSLGGG